MAENGATSGAQGGEERRDFLKILFGATAAVGAGAIVWSFGSALEPGEAARDQSVFDVDLTPIEPNSGISLRWRGQPVFIRHLTAAQVSAVAATPMKDLLDPATVKQRVKAGHHQFAVVIGICPHRGCIPVGNKASDLRGPYDGWLCPCHGAAFDAVGRVRRGPARRNLAIPRYRFVSDTLIRLG